MGTIGLLLIILIIVSFISLIYLRLILREIKYSFIDLRKTLSKDLYDNEVLLKNIEKNTRT